MILTTGNMVPYMFGLFRGCGTYLSPDSNPGPLGGTYPVFPYHKLRIQIPALTEHNKLVHQCMQTYCLCDHHYEYH